MGTITSKNESIDIAKVADDILLLYFTAETQDMHYLPYGDKRNQSGFTFHQLTLEILKRMKK